MLKLNGVSAAYGDVQVLWDISFEVRSGEIVALIGSNGAGKTTPLKPISGLIKPLRGTIVFDGNNLESRKAPEITDAGIAQVPEGRQLFPSMTVRENLELGAYLPRAKAKRAETLEEVYAIFPRLKEREKQIAGTLSGGEQQMAAIGRSLMSLPRLLMLDEPSLGLAPTVVQKIFEVVSDLRSKKNLTVLVVEQDLKKALSVADRAYVMENGRIVQEGEAKLLMGDERIRKAYLGI